MHKTTFKLRKLVKLAERLAEILNSTTDTHVNSGDFYLNDNESELSFNPTLNYDIALLNKNIYSLNLK